MSPAGNLTTDKPHPCNYPRRGDPLSWITRVSLPCNELVASCLISAWPLSLPCKLDSFCQLHPGISTTESAVPLSAGTHGCVSGQQLVPNLPVLKTPAGPGTAGASSIRFRVVGEGI